MKKVFFIFVSIIHLLLISTVTAEQNVNDARSIQEKFHEFINSGTPVFFKSFLEVIGRNGFGKKIIDTATFESIELAWNAGFQSSATFYNLADAGSGSIIHTINEAVCGNNINHNQNNLIQILAYRFFARYFVRQAEIQLVRAGENHNINDLNTRMFISMLFLATTWILELKEDQSEAIKSGIQEFKIKGVLNHVDFITTHFITSNLNYPWYINLLASSAIMSVWDSYLIDRKKNESGTEKAEGLFGRFLGYIFTR